MEHMFWLTDAYGPRLTGSPGFEQAGDWTVKNASRLGPAERPQGTVPVRQGLVAREVPRDDDRAAGDADHRHAEGVDAGDERPRDRRRRAAADLERRRGGEVQGQAARQDRAHAAGARRADARRARRAPDERQGHRRSAVAARAARGRCRTGGRSRRWTSRRGRRGWRTRGRTRRSAAGTPALRRQ